MAGDWIKMRMDLQRHPKVVRIASACNADKFRAIGGLHAVWSVFDEHSADGVLEGYTFAAMDDAIGWPGFSKAMASVSWLVFTDGVGLSMPEFTEHNGQSAKRRAMESKRKRQERDADERPHDVGEMSASNADKKRTREEKRREERKDTPQTPPGDAGHSLPGADDPLFVQFYEAYPRKTGRADAWKAWRAIKPVPTATLLAEILSGVELWKATPRWTKDGGQFIKTPGPFLRLRMWADDEIRGGDLAGKPNQVAL